MDFSQVKAWTIPEGQVKRAWIGGQLVWQAPNPLPYDAEVQYLESTGTQYVDTGCVASSSLGLEFDLEYLGTYSATVNAPGVLLRRGSSYVRHHLARGTESAWLYYLGPETVSFAMADAARRVSVTVDAVGRTVSVNGVTGSWDSVADFDTGLTYWLPARHDSNGTATPFVGRIYSATFYVSGALVRDFQPVRVGSGSSAVGYLYDRVSGQLFGNAGTGAFVVGPDKIPS